VSKASKAIASTKLDLADKSAFYRKRPKYQLRSSRKWYSPKGWRHQEGIMVKSHHDWKDIFESCSSNRMKTAQVMASYGSLKKNCSVLNSLYKAK